MLKFHEYLAHRDGITLDEAARRSLARTWELAKTGKVMVLITGFVQGLPHDKNVARNAVLARTIRDAGFGYTPLYGYWAYDEADPETGAVLKRKAREDTFLVSAPARISNSELKSIVLKWIRDYRQEAAVVKYADSEIAHLLVANGTEVPLGKWSINRLSSIYSQMRGGDDKSYRAFVFEAADDHSWSTQLAIEAMSDE
ncbi:hypothetical protein BH11PLA2_BH11PLA2_16140 [soil metagenome]